MTYGISIFNEAGLDMVPHMPLYRFITPLIGCSVLTVGVVQKWHVPASDFTVTGSLMALRLPENEWYNWNLYSGVLVFDQFYGSTYQPQPHYRVVAPVPPSIDNSGYGMQIFSETGSPLIDSNMELLKFSSSDLITKTVYSNSPEIYIGSNTTDNGYIMIQSLEGGVINIDTWEDIWVEYRVDIKRVGRDYYARYYYAHDPHAHYPPQVITTLRLRGAFAD